MEYPKIQNVLDRDPVTNKLVDGKWRAPEFEALIGLVKAKPHSTWGPFEMEGFIAKPPVELMNRFGERVITKIKCRDF
jgi:hypothetical protein